MTDELSPAVFVDRDGTIIEDRDYCSDPKDVEIFPGAREALWRLKSNGFKIIIITNQSGIGRGSDCRDDRLAIVENGVVIRLPSGDAGIQAGDHVVLQPSGK